MPRPAPIISGFGLPRRVRVFLPSLYVPDPMELEDHVPVYISEPEHPEDLVPVEDEAPTPLLPPSFLSPRSRPLSPRALKVEMRDIAGPYHCYLYLHHLLAAELIFPRLTHRLGRDYYLPLLDLRKDRAAVRAEIEVLRRERLAYEQESMETRQALARSKAHCRALKARVIVLETEVHCHEWQRQAADDLAVQHIMRTQALKAGARVDTLEDTGSSS
ncbi:hypothetical protein Tco_0043165 [Tanacetum coccineum]